MTRYRKRRTITLRKLYKSNPVYRLKREVTRLTSFINSFDKENNSPEYSVHFVLAVFVKSLYISALTEHVADFLKDLSIWLFPATNTPCKPLLLLNSHEYYLKPNHERVQNKIPKEDYTHV